MSKSERSNRVDVREPRSAAEAKIKREVRKVDSMRLYGEPKIIVLDGPTLTTGSKTAQESLLGKLKSQVSYGKKLVIIDEGGQVQNRLTGIPETSLSVVSSMSEVPTSKPAIATLSYPYLLPDNILAGFYVGEGEPPQGMYQTRKTGADGADEVYDLLAAAAGQDKAGAAFRAAGKKQPIPTSYPYDRNVLSGISITLAPMTPERVTQVVRQHEDQVRDFEAGRSNELLKRAIGPILKAFAENGAIAAAPEYAHNRGYWFRWLRDEGQIAIAAKNYAEATDDPESKSFLNENLGRNMEFIRDFAKREDIQKKKLLGVSRCEMDGTPIESYGNPQNDGPAHSALNVMHNLKENHEAAYEITKPYIDFFTTEEGTGLTFDPWEYAVGDIFNPLNLGRRVLKRGSDLARKNGDTHTESFYKIKAAALEIQLEKFYDKKKGYIVAGKDFVNPWISETKNLDISIIGSILTAYDVTDNFMNVEDERVMKTMLALENEFADRWPVNIAWKQAGNEGMGMGRRPEDTNDGIGSTGGNPWTFATLWASQYYLRLIQRYEYLATKGDVREYDREALMKKAEGYLKFTLAHLPVDNLTEQIDGQTGKPRGADELAWAHAELINTLLMLNDTKTAQL